MGSPSQSTSSLLNTNQPVKSLSIAFCLWKALLFVIILGCPGLGYDTSTSHLPYQDGSSAFNVISGSITHASLSPPLKFVRWDSIYFLHIAGSGYVFEQEWAFSYCYGKLINLLASVAFPQPQGLSGAISLAAVAAVALSHITHYLSVLALYQLSVNVFGDETAKKKLFCLFAAALHILSPAGAFLSAPYGESLFSFLNISGFYIYSSSQLDYGFGKKVSSYLKSLLAAILFAAAITIRSNGILSGFLFAYDALLMLFRIISHRSLGGYGARLCFLIAGGIIVALGLVIPQFLAYTIYCTHKEITRPWCQSFIPSIYGWVQSHYWGVGFFRYWKVSNLPLFLLASPMLVILFRSCLWALKATLFRVSHKSPNQVDSPQLPYSASLLLPHLAITQLLLAIMALVSYHVQIINRIASGYPLWYWYIAWQALESQGGTQAMAKRNQYFSAAVQAMVVYALVQATLFGSFLPPA